MSAEPRSAADVFAQVGQALAQNFLAALAKPAGAAPASGFEATGASAKIAALQARCAREHMALWAAMLRAESAREAGPAALAAAADRRFAGREWRSSPYFDFLSQSYLINVRFLADYVEALEIAAPEKDRLRFALRQVADAMSPANFAATNPEALKLALETQGASLTAGIQNLLQDVQKGRISTTDESAFEVGRNLAATPGAVIFENELMQVIQYQSATRSVRKRPLVVIPPCINKYYILDLQAENSFIRYCVEQGNTVYMVSWRNILAEQGHFTWDDYLGVGIIKALEVAREVSAIERLNAIGYCVGGTMLAAVLAILQAKGKDWIESVAYFTALHDFSAAGDLLLFIDEASVAAREHSIGRGGVMPGRELDFVFSVLRANDLVWSYVANNYLKGRSPKAFDLLHWNADSTNLPGPMYCWYVRNMYLENNLCSPGKLTMLGVPIDPSRVQLPAYVLATREDHIVPWKSAYRTTQLLGGETRFVLGASGHVAGVVNPAAKNRRSFWVNAHTPPDPQDWLGGAQEVPGSWWTDWNAWIARFGGARTKARKRLGNSRYRPIEPAPGRYVKQRVV
ncbi:MAG: class I poly(R)-hydroxyalkanoic acid synthase [Betaproteobacteria bacterium]|nr:class I poly(R)-hydroxyalkanoic acid synthase [Betaproteobacteria bacterium]